MRVIDEKLVINCQGGKVLESDRHTVTPSRMEAPTPNNRLASSVLIIRISSSVGSLPSSASCPFSIRMPLERINWTCGSDPSSSDTIYTTPLKTYSLSKTVQPEHGANEEWHARVREAGTYLAHGPQASSEAPDYFSMRAEFVVGQAVLPGVYVVGWKKERWEDMKCRGRG